MGSQPCLLLLTWKYVLHTPKQAQKFAPASQTRPAAWRQPRVRAAPWSACWPPPAASAPPPSPASPARAAQGSGMGTQPLSTCLLRACACAGLRKGDDDRGLACSAAHADPVRTMGAFGCSGSRGWQLRGANTIRMCMIPFWFPTENLLSVRMRQALTQVGQRVSTRMLLRWPGRETRGTEN